MTVKELLELEQIQLDDEVIDYNENKYNDFNYSNGDMRIRQYLEFEVRKMATDNAYTKCYKSYPINRC